MADVRSIPGSWQRCATESWPLYSALKVLAVVLPAGRRADVLMPRNLTGSVIFSIK